jgi:CBS domain-containing protein
MTQSDSLFDILRRHSPFDLLPQATLITIADEIEQRRYDHGEVILPANAVSQDLFVIIDGMVDVQSGAGTVVTLVPHEAFPLEALYSTSERQQAMCAYVANGSLGLIQIPATVIARLRSICAEFDHFCVSRSVVYQQRVVASPDGGTGRLNFQLGSLLPKRPMAILPPEATIREAVHELHRQHCREVVLVSEGIPVGIFTQSDLVSRVLVPELGLDIPVAQVMSTKLATLSTQDRGFDAIVEMSRSGVRHMVLVDEKSYFVGVIADHDLLQAQQDHTDLHNVILYCQSDADLIAAAAKIRQMAAGLVAEGIEAGHLTRLVSKLNDSLVERIVEISAAHAGIAMEDFCWVALGSEGRHEQTLHTDQDNGLVFSCEDPELVESTRQAMLGFAREVNQILDKCGFPLCSGNIMASNPDCCLTADEWKKRFIQWINTPTPEALLNATIYFDLRPLCGNRALCEGLMDWLVEAPRPHKRFFHLMTENALQRRPPIGMFRDFAVDKADSCLDLKLQGLALLVDGARILGLAAGSRSSTTIDRFRAAEQLKLFKPGDVANSIAAFNMIQKIRLHHHNAQISRAEAPNNRINPYALNNIDRKGLLESLRHADNLQKIISSRFNLAGRM